MLDIEQYRMSESLARQDRRIWQQAKAHRLDVFEGAGFPVRVNSIAELDQIVGSMHSNDRYALLHDEIAGFDEADLRLFIAVLADFYAFYATMFPRPAVTLPLAEMIAHLAIYKMIRAYNPRFRSVLEIGPGNGLLSFFMARHPGLDDYTQIEACESFYLLQSLINTHLFGPKFDERARPQALAAQANCYVGSGAVAVGEVTRQPELNPTLPMQLAPCCHHVPWWRIGDIAEHGRRYDIATSNANMLECSSAALDDYIALMREVLADDGILYVQCFGSRVYRQIDEAILKLYDAGFRALLLLPDGGALNGGEPGQEKRLALGNGIFVKPGHPHYDEAAAQPAVNVASDCAAVHRMCFGDDGAARRPQSEAEILQAVAAEVQAREAQMAA